MSEQQILYCLIAFVLGWLTSRMMGNGFNVGAAWQCANQATCDRMSGWCREIDALLWHNSTGYICEKYDGPNKPGVCVCPDGYEPE